MFFKPKHTTNVMLKQKISENLKFIKPKLIKPRRLFWGVPLTFLFWEICLGIIIGYLSACFFSGKETGLQGRIRSLLFSVGAWKIHFHHWLYGSIILTCLLFVKSSLPQFSFGILGGFILQGIVCYPDWHRIIIRQK